MGSVEYLNSRNGSILGEIEVRKIDTTNIYTVAGEAFAEGYMSDYFLAIYAGCQATSQ